MNSLSQWYKENWKIFDSLFQLQIQILRIHREQFNSVLFICHNFVLSGEGFYKQTNKKSNIDRKTVSQPFPIQEFHWFSTSQKWIKWKKRKWILGISGSGVEEIEGSYVLPILDVLWITMGFLVYNKSVALDIYLVASHSTDFLMEKEKC